MRRRFEGQSVFITGASSGIGAAMAAEFARQGAHVTLAARRADLLEEVRLKIEAMGQRAIAVVCDVTKPETLVEAAARAAKEFGGIDVAVANAGYGVSGVMEDLDTSWYRRQFDTNFFGLLDTVYAVLPYLVERRGRIGLVSSVAGRAGTPGTSAYVASKFAVTGLAESIYYELADRGVSVTCIQPGFVESDIRRVDNRGVLHKNAKDPVPPWVVVRTDKAARSIVRYIYRRKFDAVITGHGKVMVWLSRHLSWLMRIVVRLGTRGKNLPRKLSRRQE